MQIVTVSEQGTVVIPLDIRKHLGITPGCQLSFILEGSRLILEVKPQIKTTRPEDGYGFLVCKDLGERHLAEFDVAETITDQALDFITLQKQHLSNTEVFLRSVTGGLSEDFPDDISDDGIN